MLMLRAAVVAKTRAHALGTSRVLAYAEEPLFPGVEALRIMRLALALKCRVHIMPCAAMWPDLPGKRDCQATAPLWKRLGEDETLDGIPQVRYNMTQDAHV